MLAWESWPSASRNGTPSSLIQSGFKRGPRARRMGRSTRRWRAAFCSRRSSRRLSDGMRFRVKLAVSDIALTMRVLYGAMLSSQPRVGYRPFERIQSSSSYFRGHRFFVRIHCRSVHMQAYECLFCFFTIERACSGNIASLPPRPTYVVTQAARLRPPFHLCTKETRMPRQKSPIRHSAQEHTNKNQGNARANP